MIDSSTEDALKDSVSSTIKTINSIDGYIEIDSPNKNIYCIEGCVYIDGKEDQKIYFDNSNCLLRGGVLKNVNFVYGIVIYTGRETKIMMNIKNMAQKLSSLDKLINKIVIFIVSISVVLAIIFASVGITRSMKNRPSESNPRMEYVFYGENNSDKVLDSIRIFISFCYNFFTLIPVSVMVCLEAVKGFQTLFLIADEGYYNEKEGEKMKCLSMKLHENLGMIKYVFTDKTGTLTKNEMEFKGCSIFTKLYSQVESATTVYDTVDISSRQKSKSIFSKDFNPLMLLDSLAADEQLEISDETGECYFRTLKEITTEFFLNIALNHNVLVNEEEEEEKGAVKVNEPFKSSYSGSNPDEVVLVQAAKEIGIEFVEKVGNTCTILLNGKKEEFTLLQRFDFTSARKRSSIIVRDSKGKIKMYMKGADNVVLRKLNNFSRDMLLFKTNEHVDKFSKEGLRTLCYSMKILTEEEYKDFQTKYEKLQSNYLENKELVETQIEELKGELEENMLLLGVTALEDMLQDNVKNTIKEFMEADINVWMLTGDKLDTAESIGYSCRLLTDDTELYKIREKDKGRLSDVLNSIDESMNNIFGNPNNKEEILEYMDQNSPDEDKNKKEIPTNRTRGKSRSFKYDKKNFVIKLNTAMKKRKNFQRGGRKFSLQDRPRKSKNLELGEGEEINENKGLEVPKGFITNQESAQRLQRDSEYEGLKRQRINTEDFNIKGNFNIELSQLPQGNPTNGSNNGDDVNSIYFQNETDNIKNENASSQIENSTKNQVPNDNSIANYLMKKNFFNQSSFKDNSFSFIQRIKNSKTEANIRKIKTEYKTQLGHFNEESENKNGFDNGLQFRNFSLMIEGEAIEGCLAEENADKFYNCLTRCRSVICSRCTPIQKSQIVEFVKNRISTTEKTLAIGDGGNDINMIQSADVGIGIFGKEGSQAAYSSDYAFSQFQYIRRLLFVHGRFSLWRNTYYANYYFFKSVIYVVPQVLFSFFSFLSGTQFFDDYYMMGYNSFLTIIPALIFCIFEEDIDITFSKAKKKELARMLIPDLYKQMRDRKMLSMTRFVASFMAGIFMGIVLFFVCLFSYRFNAIDDEGRMGSMTEFSFCVVWCTILVPYFVLIIDEYLFNVIVSALHGIQILLFIVFPFVCDTIEGSLYGKKLDDFTHNTKFFLTLLMGTGVNILIFFGIRTVERFFVDNLAMRVRLDEITSDIQRKVSFKKMVEATKLERCVSKFKRMYNRDVDEIEAENYAEKKIKDFVTKFKSSREDNKELFLRKVSKHASKVENDLIKKVKKRKYSNNY